MNPKMTLRLLALSLLLLSAVPAAGASGVCDITEFGAVGDGQTLCTQAIQRAVDACAQSGGGMVLVPPGRFLTGPIFLKSNVNFHLFAGAVLLASENMDDYPTIAGRWEGIERTIYASILTGHKLENVSITGRGTINARGKIWWDAEKENERIRKQLGITEREPDNPPASPLKWPRPRVINLYNCTNVLVRDLTILDSPSWTIHPVYCRDVTVDNITIIQPADSLNTDGVNPDSCQNVRISNCYIDCGDDCITIKSGYNEDGRRVGIPCENITVTNCTFLHGHGGVVIGSETSGDVRNVTISNCVFDGTQRGIRIKSSRGRGAVVEYIRASNLVMRDVNAAFSVTMKYERRKMQPEPVNEGTPRFHDFHFSNIDVSTCDRAAEIIGLEEMPIRDLRFTDMTVESAARAFDCINTEGIILSGVCVNTRKGPAYVFSDTSGIELHRVTTDKPLDNTPVISLENTRNVLVHGCRAPENTSVFIDLQGENNLDLTFENNFLDKAEIPVRRPFISWGELKNPVYAHPDWSTKDACMVRHDGWFYLFFSAFFYEHGQERSHITAVRTRDFLTFSEPLFIWSGIEEGWTGMCSPNISRIGDEFILTYNSWGDTHPNGQRNQAFYAVSDDLKNWKEHRPLARNLTDHASLIDVDVARYNDKYYVIWQDWKVGDDKVKLNRIAVGGSLDGDFSFIGDGYVTFLMKDGKENGLKHENWEFIDIDGVQHLLTTDYSPHEPCLYRISGHPADPMSWKTWTRGMRLEMPQENFNIKHRANAAFLADWRDHDGFFYMLYAGTTHSYSHAGRGDNKLALARSKDLITWQAP